jgi:hypothetical protein
MNGSILCYTAETQVTKELKYTNKVFWDMKLRH